jgi:hypothetical protein
MASTKYHGKVTAVYWKESGGSFVDVSGASRQFGIDQSGNEIDVSTRDDKNADATQYLVDVPGRTATLAGLDTTPHASRVWHDLHIGDTGQLLWYPLGVGASKPYEYGDASVTKATYSSPHDNAATWDLAWRINTAIAEGTSGA